MGQAQGYESQLGEVQMDVRTEGGTEISGFCPQLRLLPPRHFVNKFCKVWKYKSNPVRRRFGLDLIF